jgi:uncharacterized protein
MTSALIKKAISVVKPQFRLDFHDGVHGIAHWSRVWMHGRMIAREMDLNPSVLAWFAFLHDSQRENDNEDVLHGTRAADFALSLYREGVITELSPLECEQLCEAMRLHSDGHVESDAMIRACWDSDRLDLGRVGIRPDPGLLCTEPARRTEVIDLAVKRSQAMVHSDPFWNAFRSAFNS